MSYQFAQNVESKTPAGGCVRQGFLRMDGLRLAGVPGSRCHAKDPCSYPSARLGFWQAQVMSRAGHFSIEECPFRGKQKWTSLVSTRRSRAPHLSSTPGPGRSAATRCSPLGCQTGAMCFEARHLHGRSERGCSFQMVDEIATATQIALAIKEPAAMSIGPAAARP